MTAISGEEIKNNADNFSSVRTGSDSIFTKEKPEKAATERTRGGKKLLKENETGSSSGEVNQVYRAYQEIFYPKVANFRGATRLKKVLEDLLVWRPRKNKDGSYTVKVDGYDVLVDKKEDAHEHVINQQSVITGYEKYRAVRENDLVLDGGAYPGVFTVYAAKKADHVIALEPDPRNAEHLRENLELNDVEDSVTVLEKGLWSKETCLELVQGGLASRLEETSSEEGVPVTTLDSLAGEYGVFDFVKMDVEGAEVEAVKAAENLLGNTYFAIASYHEVDGKETHKLIEEILSDRGLDFETGFPSHITTWISGSDSQNLRYSMNPYMEGKV